MPSNADFYPSGFACLPLVLNGTGVDSSVLIGFYFYTIFNCETFSMRIRGDNHLGRNSFNNRNKKKVIHPNLLSNPPELDVISPLHKLFFLPILHIIKLIPDTDSCCHQCFRFAFVVPPENLSPREKKAIRGTSEG